MVLIKRRIGIINLVTTKQKYITLQTFFVGYGHVRRRRCFEEDAESSLKKKYE